MPAARLHATCVAIDGRGVLLTGAPGSGKSDLALRLIDRGARLVSDDQVDLVELDGLLLASAPATIAGLLEVRGIGIVNFKAVRSVPVALLVALDGPVPRMPDASPAMETIASVGVPIIALAPFEASAPIKVERALAKFGIVG